MCHWLLLFIVEFVNENIYKIYGNHLIKNDLTKEFILVSISIMRFANKTIFAKVLFITRYMFAILVHFQFITCHNIWRVIFIDQPVFNYAV